MKVSAKLENLRIAPRKVRLVTDLIKKMDVDEALNQLDTTIKGGSEPIKKLLLSAVSNGENNSGIDRSNMYIFDIIVNAGPVLKRWMPKAYGRAGQILKRTSRVEIILEERIEGKGRKSKEQLEKERQGRIEEKKKLEKERQSASEAEEKELREVKDKTKSVEKSKETDKFQKGKEKTGGWGSKIFRRKSM